MISRCLLTAMLCGMVLCLQSQHVPFEQFRIPSNQCFHFETTGGSHIFIEEGALLSENDSISISYREFIDPVDMILHDVQMHVSLGSDRLQLESSGMFEIYALDGQDTIPVQQGKRLYVQMGIEEVPPRDSQGYKYNTSNGVWDTYQPFVGMQAVSDDDDLWGSPPFSQEGIVEEWDDGGFGWSESFSAADSMRREVFQSMEITDFGLFNYDKVVDGVEYQYLQASFADGQGKELTSTIYVVYEDINSVFYFPKYNWESQFFLIKDRPYKLFTIGEQGEVKVLDKYPELANLDMGASHTFLLNSRRSGDDMRDTLGAILSTP